MQPLLPPFLRKHGQNVGQLRLRQIGTLHGKPDAADFKDSKKIIIPVFSPVMPDRDFPSVYQRNRKAVICK